MPASEPDKSAFTEKPKTPKPGNGKSDPYLRELQNLVAQVKTKYPGLAIESWYGKNRGAHQDAILHVLRSFLKAELKYDSGSAMEKYLQNAIDVEDGKYNARDFDQGQGGKRGPPTVQGMAALGRIMDSVRVKQGY
ncbi:MAG: hypothetical protein ABIJ57_03115 [Pseudomonadota bacterium]